MNKLARYIIIIASVAFVCFILWYFSRIVGYILTSTVLALLGKPIVRRLKKVKIGRYKCPDSLAAAIGLLMILGFFALFFWAFIPLLTAQFNELAKVNVTSLIDSMSAPLSELNVFVHKFLPAKYNDFSLNKEIAKQIGSLIDPSFFTTLFSSTASILTDTFVMIFAVAFITFFFLKEEDLFTNGLAFFFPARYSSNLKHAMERVNSLLTRYFIGLFLESLVVMLLTVVGMVILGLPFKTSMVIGLIAGVLNVIPYIGALIALGFALLLPLAVYVNGGAPMSIYMLLVLIVLIFLIVRLVDNFFLQPLIYSSSAHAHPLEIFIVLLIGAQIASVLGMLLAIPAYTAIRVFAKEFFNNFQLVQRLTKNI